MLYPPEIVKNVGGKIDPHLSWQCQIRDLSFKLNRPDTLLFKIRKYLSPKILGTIYFAIFDSHLSYCSYVWDQNFRTIQRIQARLMSLLVSLSFPSEKCVKYTLQFRVHTLEQLLFCEICLPPLESKVDF